MEKFKDFLNLRYYLRKKLVNFYNLGLDEKAPFFTRISSIITKKEAVNTTSSLLNAINGLCLGNKLAEVNSPGESKKLFITQKQTRVFLSSYISVYHSHTLTTAENIQDDPNSLLFQIKSTALLSTLKKVYTYCVTDFNEFMLKLYIEKFIRLFSEYENSFKLWKEIDERKILDELMIVYIELLEFKESDKERDSRYIDSECISVKDKILKLNGEDGIKILEHNIELYYKYKDNMRNLYDNIYTSIHKAFWEDLRIKLYNIPPDYTIIVPLLGDIKKLLIECVPSRIDLKSEIDEIIDLEYIQNMICDDVIDDKYVQNLSNFILSQIKTFQARTEDEDTDKLQEFTDSTFTQLNLVCIPEKRVDIYADFFPTFFKKIFKKLEDIVSASATIRNIVQNY